MRSKELLTGLPWHDGKVIYRSVAAAVPMAIAVNEKRASLVPSIKELISAIVKKPPVDVEVRKLTVIGTDNDYVSIPIDVLKDRLSFEVDVYFDAFRRLPFATRQQGLREAWGMYERAVPAPTP